MMAAHGGLLPLFNAKATARYAPLAHGISRFSHEVGSRRGTVLLCFFFSSRRRHTRYWRDWSSDVCSSDLPAYRGRCRRRDPPHARGPRRRHTAAPGGRTEMTVAEDSEVLELPVLAVVGRPNV